MNAKLKIFCLVFFTCVMLVCFTFTGCNGNTVTQSNETSGAVQGDDVAEDAYNNISYVKTVVEYAEPGSAYGSSYALRKDMEVATVGTTAYGFEPSISADYRIECIKQTEKILRELPNAEDISVYIYKKITYDSDYVSEHSVYTYQRNWQSVEYVTDIILGAYGEYCNYGMAYGYASYICNKLYETPIDTKSLKFDSDFGYYDLNYLCFHQDFSSDDDINIVKSIANNFVAEYVEKNGANAFADLLIMSGNETAYTNANAALYEYYNRNGISPDLSDVLYKFGGMGSQYIVRCKYATICVQKDWLDRLTLMYPDVYDGFLNNNYAETDAFFNVNAEQMGKYQDLFGLDDYDNSVVAVFSNRNAADSHYVYNIHHMEILNISSFMHEFIHSLTCHRIFNDGGLCEDWVSEGLARYYGWKWSEYGNDMLYGDYSNNQYLQTFISQLGRPLDLAIDYPDVCNIFAYIDGKTPGDSPYWSGSSFIHYLVITYGEQETLQYLLVNYDLSTLTDKSFDEVLIDWQGYLETMYSKYVE